MRTDILLALVILVLAVTGAALAWRAPAGWICLVIAVIEIVSLLPGGPW